MGRIKKKKREISLSLFYLKYFIYVFISVTVVGILVVFSFTILFIGDVIYPANYAQEQANKAYKNILNAEEVSQGIIPELSQYVIFDIKGEVKAGNIEKKGIRRAWEAVKGNSSDAYGNFYKVVPRQKEYVVLRYKIIPQYKAPVLRKYLFPPQITIFVVALVLIFISIVVIAIRFGSALKKKLRPLIVATNKIQNKELEFVVETDNIKELNTVLTSMDNMRMALKSSLETQWKMEQARKEQIASLAHDLKTPLTLIRGNAELLNDTNPTKEQLECIHYIEASSLQMQNYVQMLMEVTKSEDKMKMQKREVIIDDFLNEIYAQAKGLCLVKQIQLQWDCNYQSKNITIDKSLLERAIMNVISNAIEHTPVGKTVTFNVREERENIIFSISDTGRGFLKEELKHATEQFYRGDASRNSKSHYGMGLYIADSIVKQHGGQLTLENKRKEQGAKVIFQIPFTI